MQGARFSVVHNIYASDRRGSYRSENNKIDINSSIEMGARLRKTMFHELTHALSGTRDIKSDTPESTTNRRLGLRNVITPNQASSRVWLNEAFTELFAEAMFVNDDETRLDFGSDQPIPLQALERIRNKCKGINSYELQIDSLIASFSGIPLKTLSRAYFAQDFDPLDASDTQTAGRRAERDLQRRLKVAGGMGRIKQLRLLERTIASEDISTLYNSLTAMHKSDQLTLQTPELMSHNVLALQNLQKRREAGIARARAHAHPKQTTGLRAVMIASLLRGWPVNFEIGPFTGAAAAR